MGSISVQDNWPVFSFCSLCRTLALGKLSWEEASSFASVWFLYIQSPKLMPLKVFIYSLSVCMCVCMLVCLRECMYKCASVWECAYICVRIFVCLYGSMCVYVCIYERVCVHVHLCVSVCVCMYVCLCVYVYNDVKRSEDSVGVSSLLPLWISGLELKLSGLVTSAFICWGNSLVLC